MKPKLFVPIMLFVFLAGTITSFGQDRNEKKINRIQRKIEKQSKKLQELTGDEFRAFEEIAPPMDSEEIEKIREEALAQADEAREQAREVMEEQREAFEEQREAMAEQRDAMLDRKRDLNKKMIIIRKKNGENLEVIRELDLDKLEDLKELKENEMEVFKDLNGKKLHYYYKTPRWESKDGEAFLFDGAGDIKIDIPEFKGGGVYRFHTDTQDNLSINKILADESSSADFNYEVKEGASGLSVLVNGAIDSGKVKILIRRPDGEVYNEYTLSPLANVNWKQSIRFEDQEESEYLGKWTVSVTAEKAKGNYSVQINGR